ncbi:type II secretion system protein K (GspK) [Noviherbaspirillum humi]|uniref:Type II secretion system protein K n=1 Tax=Noviherbaspirillum humi TaxID=1688639 RepID=A0A239CDT1_9BURK|nr:type II secretion system minor pseudopilin GspK [Noviherbaspirillum humi]SNS18357.1 type II secretion system protein K (GspK) [Noviherbaspirillum humi]
MAARVTIRQARLRRKQRGVAVVTALLLTTLAITIVASLFWQQQVQVRSIENQRLQLQKQWILRGALDWTRLILREDARFSKVDYLGEPWAVKLAETRLDQYVDNAQSQADVPDAALSGGITDAQGRFNLNNLATDGKPNPGEVAVFGRLLTNLRLEPALAQATADLLASAQRARISAGAVAGQAGQAGGAATPGAGGQAKPMPIWQADDLLAVTGFTPAMLDKVKDFVIVLPARAGLTPVNVNTAPAEVLAARIESLSLAEANALVAARERTYFRDAADFTQRLQGKSIGGASIDVKTSFFLVLGDVRLNRATLNMQALIERNGLNTKVIWIREN